jgi:hypothetical protein
MEYTATTMTGAAQRNKLAEVQYLHIQGCPWPPRIFKNAASSGYFELLCWCHEHDCPWEASKAATYAAESGNIELMAWVLQQPDTQLSEHVMFAAVATGDIPICQYLRAQQCPWDAHSTCLAASDRDVDLLRWLLDNGCPFNANRLIESAAQGGSVEVLAFLQQRGILEHAAHYNELAAPQWLRNQGAQWPTDLGWDLWRGDDVLVWARSEGYISTTD